MDKENSKRDELLRAGLGRLPDIVVAARVGVSLQALRHWQAKLSIEPVQQEHRLPRTLAGLRQVGDWHAYVARLVAEHEARVMAEPVTDELLEREQDNWPLYHKLLAKREG